MNYEKIVRSVVKIRIMSAYALNTLNNLNNLNNLTTNH